MLAFRPQRLFRWLSSPLHFVFLSILNVFLSKPLRFSCTALHFKLIVPAIRHSFLAQYDIYNVATGRLVVGTFSTKIFCQHLVSRSNSISKLQADQAPARPGRVDQAAGRPCSSSTSQGTGDHTSQPGEKQKSEWTSFFVRLPHNSPLNTQCGDQGATPLPMSLVQISTTGLKKVSFFCKSIFFVQGNPRITWRDGDTDWTTRSYLQRCCRLGLRRRGALSAQTLEIFKWWFDVQVLSDTRAIWFSPDGDKIAWTQFNDTDVRIFHGVYGVGKSRSQTWPLMLYSRWT